MLSKKRYQRRVEALTQSRLQSVLHYDPKTGVFVWSAPRPKVVVGARAGHQHHTGYRYIVVLGKSYPEHHLAWLYTTGRWPDEFLDHKNRVRNDNRWANLRPASRKQNNENASVRSDNISGVRGVCWSTQENKWRAYIYHHKKQIDLGFFASKAAAARARKAAEQRYFTHL